MKEPKIRDLEIDLKGTPEIRRKMAQGRAVKITINIDADSLAILRTWSARSGTPCQRLLNQLLKRALQDEAETESRCASPIIHKAANSSSKRGRPGAQLCYKSKLMTSFFISYYHSDRIHDSLEKDTPAMRPVSSRPDQAARLVSIRRIGGLHHRYDWQQAA
jgi:hypothetical protein